MWRSQALSQLLTDQTQKGGRVLKLCNSNIGSESAGLLASYLQQQDVVDLDLSENQIWDRGVSLLVQARGFGALQRLDLSENRLRSAGATAIAKALLLGWQCRLLDLDLGGNRVGNLGAAALCQCLSSKDVRLQSLSLRANGIKERGVEVMATALEANVTLTRLDISENQVGPSGAKALANALRQNVTLVCLGCAAARVRAEGATALAGALGHNVTLTSLDLSAQAGFGPGGTGTRPTGEGSIGDDGAKALALALDRRAEGERGDQNEGGSANVTLCALDLGANAIGPDGAKALAKAVAGNDSLVDLGLEWNEIRSSGAETLLAGLEANTSLTRLALQGNAGVAPSLCGQVETLLAAHTEHSARLLAVRDKERKQARQVTMVDNLESGRVILQQLVNDVEYKAELSEQRFGQLRSHTAALEARSAQAVETRARMEEECRSLRLVIADLEGRYAKSTMLLDKHLAEESGLEAKRKAAEARLTEEMEMADKWEAMVLELRKERDLLELSRRNAEAEAVAQEHASGRLRRECSDLEMRVAKAQDRCTRAEKDARVLREEIQVSEMKISAIASRSGEHSAGVAELTRLRDELERHAASVEARDATMRLNTAGLDSVHKAMQHYIREVQAEGSSLILTSPPRGGGGGGNRAPGLQQHQPALHGAGLSVPLVGLGKTAASSSSTSAAGTDVASAGTAQTSLAWGAGSDSVAASAGTGTAAASTSKSKSPVSAVSAVRVPPGRKSGASSTASQSSRAATTSTSTPAAAAPAPAPAAVPAPAPAPAPLDARAAHEARENEKARLRRVLTEGAALMKKMGNETKYQFPRYIWASDDLRTLHWAKGQTRNNKSKSIVVADIVAVDAGAPVKCRKSESLKPGFDDVTFTIRMNKAKASVDLRVHGNHDAAAMQVRDDWVEALTLAMNGGLEPEEGEVEEAKVEEEEDVGDDDEIVDDDDDDEGDAEDEASAQATFPPAPAEEMESNVQEKAEEGGEEEENADGAMLVEDIATEMDYGGGGMGPSATTSPPPAAPAPAPARRRAAEDDASADVVDFEPASESEENVPASPVPAPAPAVQRREESREKKEEEEEYAEEMRGRSRYRDPGEAARQTTNGLRVDTSLGGEDGATSEGAVRGRGRGRGSILETPKEATEAELLDIMDSLRNRLETTSDSSSLTFKSLRLFVESEQGVSYEGKEWRRWFRKAIKSIVAEIEAQAAEEGTDFTAGDTVEDTNTPAAAPEPEAHTTRGRQAGMSSSNKRLSQPSTTAAVPGGGGRYGDGDNDDGWGESVSQVSRASDNDMSGLESRRSVRHLRGDDFGANAASPRKASTREKEAMWVALEQRLETADEGDDMTFKSLRLFVEKKLGRTYDGKEWRKWFRKAIKDIVRKIEEEQDAGDGTVSDEFDYG